MYENERTKKVLEILKEEFPEVSTPLLHSNAFELLVAAMLSPQTPDDTTNKIVPKLYEKYPTPQDLSKAEYEDVLKIIRPINFNKTKAKRLIKMAQILIEKYDGKVPSDLDDLMGIPGVGRKVANVVRSEWFVRHGDVRRISEVSCSKKNTPRPPLKRGGDDAYSFSSDHNLSPDGLRRGIERRGVETVEPQGFVVDTHVKRVSYRLGLTESKDPKTIEKDLMQLFSKDEWVDLSLRFIFHGRKTCDARKPRCNECPLKELCPKVGVGE